MKKSVLLFLMLFTVLGFISAQEEALTVSYWVGIDNNTFKQRVENEVENELLNSNEWDFKLASNANDADIHLVLASVNIKGMSGYAWGVSFTPLFAPQFNNTNAATSEASISAMNWIARQLVEFVEEQLYIILDKVNNSQEDLDVPKI